MNSSQKTAPQAGATRHIVVGRSSKVWQHLRQRPELAQHVAHAIGHADLKSFTFTQHDCVWVFSYSREPSENASLLATLGRAGVGEVMYLSSSSTIVNRVTNCYSYPRVKYKAEQLALSLPHAKIITLGLMYQDLAELPAGRNMACSYDELAAFMLRAETGAEAQNRVNLLRAIERPFSSTLERLAYQQYSKLMSMMGSKPCLLRPLDFLFRALGWRWYGYTFLSNRLWSMTIS